MDNHTYTVFCDGGIRRGVMAYGYVVYSPEGDVFGTGSSTCGGGTSNLAEYRALIAAIQDCRKMFISNVDIYMDSQLIVKQINNEYKVNKPELRKHKDYAISILERFEKWALNWIPRDKNKEADALVNEVFVKKFNKNDKKKKRI